MSTYIQDLGHAARALVRARAFTAVCVASLGLGMGVVMAMLLFMQSILGTPPGVDDDGLVELVIRPSGQLRAQAGQAIIDTWSYPDYLDVRDAARGTTITGWSRGDALVRLPDQDRAAAVSAMYVSSNYFSNLHVPLALGRGFTAVDDASQAEAEAVIGHRVWQTRFASDPSIVGRAIEINQSRYVIVGVAPERFRGHANGLNEPYYRLWLPLSRHPRLQPDAQQPAGVEDGASADQARFTRDVSWIRIFARMSEDTSLTQADAMVQAVMAGLAAQYPASHAERGGGVEPYFPPGARLRAQISFARMMMFSLAAIVLLVVGLNVSGMMLVRSAMRERELAIRLAIGATRWRLMRYHLSEALVMALVGGAAASAVLFGGPVVIAWWFNFSSEALDLFTPGLWLALQCTALCFITSIVLGLLPALRFSRPSVVAALKNDVAGSRRVGRLHRLTAAAQAGIAVPFLVICGVQFDRARMTAFTDVGFTPPGLYATQLNLSTVTRTAEQRRLFLQTVQDNLAHAPGIASASVADGVPLDFIYRNARVSALDPGAPGAESTFVTAHTTRIAPGYLETIGTRLLAGRTIEANDRPGAEQVVLLSEPLAQQLFPSGDPLGKQVAFALAGGEKQIYTVVGVTADLVSTQMGNPRPQLFLPLAQQPASNVLLVARGRPSDPSVRVAFENAISDALRQVAAQAPQESSARARGNFVLGELITGEGLIENSRADMLTGSGVGGAAAAVALVLAALGVYGVIAFMVATRTREIGVRVALGASRGRVLRDVVGNALKLVIPGIVVGLLLAVLWVHRVDPAWYPINGVEPLVYALAAGISFVVAALAGVPSARRAARVQPIVAMRTE
jgi:putative ABC transport system permease protein